MFSPGAQFRAFLLQKTSANLLTQRGRLRLLFGLVASAPKSMEWNGNTMAAVDKKYEHKQVKQTARACGVNQDKTLGS